ncbi:MAG: hypothetical protein AAF387_16675 [Pseudomonadota bacterium]
MAENQRLKRELAQLRLWIDVCQFGQPTAAFWNASSNRWATRNGPQASVEPSALEGS